MLAVQSFGHLPIDQPFFKQLYYCCWIFSSAQMLIRSNTPHQPKLNLNSFRTHFVKMFFDFSEKRLNGSGTPCYNLETGMRQ